MERIGTAINDVSSDKMVIVEGVGLWGHPNNFLWMRPVKARNIVYSFHMYVPHAFTDSGKKGRAAGRKYDSAGGRAQVAAAMAPVEAFSRKHDAKVYVGELGLSYATEGNGAGDWLRDVLGFLGQRGWGWAYWTYSLPFRNPEVILSPDGTLEPRGDSERLRVLKDYWQGREAPSPDARSGSTIRR